MNKNIEKEFMAPMAEAIQEIESFKTFYEYLSDNQCIYLLHAYLTPIFLKGGADKEKNSVPGLVPICEMKQTAIRLIAILLILFKNCDEKDDKWKNLWR